MAANAIDWMTDGRSEPRDAVHHRTRAVHPDGRLMPMVIVDTSQSGLMARCDADCEEGDRLRIDFPRIGSVVAEVRWSLGGRIGCRLERPLGLAEYYALLAGMRR